MASFYDRFYGVMDFHNACNGLKLSLATGDFDEVR